MDLTLLDPDGTLRTAPQASAATFDKPLSPLTSRVAFAAAHVIPVAHGDNTPGRPAEIDWESTLAFRRHIWSWGLGVADAMDTAQRNMGLDPTATRELISRSADAARDFLADPTRAAVFPEGAEVRDLLCAGVNTDQRTEADLSLSEITAAYREQLELTEESGAGAVLMSSRHLARSARSGQDYEQVYADILAVAAKPVILHWLGPAFDPELDGYFGSTDSSEAAEVLLRIVDRAPDKVRGIKMSLLDADAEVAVRSRLPEGVRLFTGDDFHFSHLIEGEGSRHSDALLGAFAVVAPNASAAIRALDEGLVEEYRGIMGPAEELARQVFSPPTYYYKTGVAFLSWLNGHQPAFSMVGGLHNARSLPHLSRIVELAAAAGALERPELARQRWHSTLRLAGYEL